MNRILFEPEEIREDGSVILAGERAEHILRVLHGRPGQIIKTGTVNGLAGNSTLLETGDGTVRLLPSHDQPAPDPWFDLLLAMPRPKVMKRLWAQLTTLGVRRIFLLNASKVEKFYFSSQWVQPEFYRPLLLEGLQQAGTTCLPKVEICPRFKPFIEDRLDELFPKEGRLLAHPMPQAEHALFQDKSFSSPTLAVGPEGGWTEYEREALLDRGFIPFSLGPRPLRTDTACISLISVLAWEAARK